MFYFVPTTRRSSNPAANSVRAHRPPVAPRWRRAAPRQQRSVETLDRLAAAAEELLREKPFEEISVQDIVERSDRPIGSFYARFGSKEALLPFLYERYDVSLETDFTARLGRIDWPRLDFDATAAAVVDVLLAMYDERRWLLRALALFARMRPEALPRDVVRRRRKLYEPLARVLLRHRERIRHSDPEAAVGFGIFLVSSIAREKLLFSQAPHARATPISRRALRRELARALTTYLASEESR